MLPYIVNSHRVVFFFAGWIYNFVDKKKINAILNSLKNSVGTFPFSPFYLQVKKNQRPCLKVGFFLKFIYLNTIISKLFVIQLFQVFHVPVLISPWL